MLILYFCALLFIKYRLPSASKYNKAALIPALCSPIPALLPLLGLTFTHICALVYPLSGVQSVPYGVDILLFL